MIERIDDCEFEITCDGCDETENIDTDGNWSEMVQQLKSQGWVVRKDADNEWQHLCPECKESIDFR